MKRIIAMLLVGSIIFSCTKKEEKTDQKAQKVSTDSSYVETDFYFKLPSYKGEEFDLRKSNGKPVLVMFFTENCPFCQKAAPFMEAIHKKYSSKGLSVVGISVKPNIESARDFAKEFNLTFEVLYNGRDTARKYGISGVPFIYLLNKDHTLRRVWAGYDKSYEKDIEEAINKIL